MTKINADLTPSAGMIEKIKQIVASPPSLVTIPNVEIVSTGTYSLSSGPATFTEEDLADAVRAQDDPAVRSPRLKIGHTTDFGDGEPCFGKVLNMRLSEDKQTIIGDYVDVPSWLAELMPAAYPSRSIEGMLEATTATDKTYGLLIDAVALLGVVAPGVGVLEDLTNLYGSEMPEGTEVLAGTKVTASVGGGMSKVAAAVEVEDVRRQFYETLDANQMWWWIRSIRLDPNELIVDDDEGSLYRVPFEVNGEEISYGDAVEVKIKYVDASTGQLVAEDPRGRSESAVYASRSESRPESTDEEEDSMDPKEIRERLGLPESASDEECFAKLDELKAETPETPEPGPGDEAEGDTEGDAEETPAEAEAVAASGVKTIDAAQLEKLQQDAALGAQARKEQVQARRKTILDAAVTAGKFPPARKEHWATLLENDPEGTEAIIAGLAEGTIPTDERGSVPAESQSKDEYPTHWLPEVEARQAEAVGAGRVQRGDD